MSWIHDTNAQLKFLAPYIVSCGHPILFFFSIFCSPQSTALQWWMIITWPSAWASSNSSHKASTCRTILRYIVYINSMNVHRTKNRFVCKGPTRLCILESSVTESWNHCPARIQHAHSNVENLPPWMMCAYIHWQPLSTLPPLPPLHDTVDNDTPPTLVDLTRSHTLHLQEINESRSLQYTVFKQ